MSVISPDKCSASSLSTSRLYKLPPELRAMVFGNLVVHDEPLVFQNFASHARYPTEANLFGDCCAYIFDSISALCPEAIGLQLAVEVAEVFFTRNTFLCREDDLKEWLDCASLKFPVSRTINEDYAMHHFVRNFTISITSLATLEPLYRQLYRMTRLRQPLTKLLDDTPEAYYPALRPLLPIIQSFRERGKHVRTTITYGHGEDKVRDLGEYFTKEIEAIAVNLAGISPLLTKDYESRRDYYREKLLYVEDSPKGLQKKIIFVENTGPDLRYRLPEAFRRDYTELLDTHVVGPEVADEATWFFYLENTFKSSSSPI
ncbi:MAG: hypothetical protein M1835_006546 [Candelina submexicana]|nr:MAG: hypothetical protein M1835_006546 [Candelina submexicana]